MDRGSSLIGKWQNIKIDFFKNATLKLLDGTTSYTLHQPLSYRPAAAASQKHVLANGTKTRFTAITASLEHISAAKKQH